MNLEKKSKPRKPRKKKQIPQPEKPARIQSRIRSRIPREKIRTKQRVIKAIVEKMAACAKGGENYSGRCYISNSACIEDAEAVKALVEERFKKLKSIEIFDIGTVIGSHTGPGTVALFFVGAKRED